MKQPTSPCLGCPDRCPEPNCHITCERYLAFSKECEVLRKERLKVAEHHYTMKAIERRRVKVEECLYELGRNIVRMQQRFPNDWEDRIVISIEHGYSRCLDVVEQISLCAPRLWININATPKAHAMRIGEKFAKLGE